MKESNYTIECKLDKNELLALSNYYSKRAKICSDFHLPEIAIEHEAKADFYLKEAERLGYEEKKQIGAKALPSD